MRYWVGNNHEAPSTLFERFNNLPGNIRGAIWLLGSGAFLSAMGVLIKVAAADLHPFEVAFFRAFFGLFVVMPFVLRHGLRSVRTEKAWLHFSRGMIGGVVMLCMFYSVAHLPLADVTALSFTKPLFLIPLAALMLGEVVRLRRTVATAVGFLGVIVMLRPGGETDPVAFVALFATSLIAFITISIKMLSRTESTTTMIFWSSLYLSLFTLAPAISVWRWPSLETFAVMAALAVCGSIGQAMLIRGYSAGETTAVTPFDYSRLIYSGVAGYIFFAEVPDLWTIVGAAIIVASTLYIARREARLKPGSKPAMTTFDGPANPTDPLVRPERSAATSD